MGKLLLKEFLNILTTDPKFKTKLVNSLFYAWFSELSLRFFCFVSATPKLIFRRGLLGFYLNDLWNCSSQNKPQNINYTTEEKNVVEQQCCSLSNSSIVTEQIRYWTAWFYILCDWDFFSVLLFSKFFCK